jgi:tryptophan-rich sensory protein
MNRNFYIQIVDKLKWIEQIVGIVWVFLSLLMFLSAWIIYQKNGFSREFWYVIALMIATWTYPLYTFGFKLVPGFIGNIVYLLFAFFVISIVSQVSINASYLLYPTVVWVSLASVYVIFQILAR